MPEIPTKIRCGLAVLANGLNIFGVIQSTTGGVLGKPMH